MSSNLPEINNTENLANTEKSSSRILEVDGLRGLAILGVLVFHFFGEGIDTEQSHWIINYLASIARYGFSGIDLFFVLSGFLIGGILLDNRDSVNYFKTFYLRRIFRIFPLYYSLIIGFYGITFLSNKQLIYIPEWIVGFTFSSKWYLIFAQNFPMARDGNLGTNVLAPTWSLAVEEQFYLILPFLIWIVPRKKLVAIILLLIGISIISVKIIESHTNPIAVRVLLPGGLIVLLTGVLVAILVRSAKAIKFIEKYRFGVKIATYLLILSFIFFQIPALWSINPFGGLVWLLNSLGLIYGLIYGLILILVIVLDPNDILRRVCRFTYLRKIGEISYCVYLIHMGVYFLIRWQLGIQNNPAFGLIWFIEITLTLIITFAIGKLSWTYFEKPLINYGHKYKYEL